MAVDSILRSFGDASAREDVVLNAITYLTAREEQIFNLLGRTQAINTTHTYLVDTYDAAASNAVLETGDYTNKPLTTPSRQSNLVENIAYPFKVSRTQRAISHYHGMDELTRQTEKAMANWGNSAEFDLVRSTLVSGASGTVPKMNGIINYISTHASNCVTAHNSGTVWSASILDGLMKGQYDRSNGEMATDLYMGSYIRKATDDFTQKSNVVVNNPGGQTRVVKTVTTYETSFGVLNLHTHRYVQISGTDATGRVLAVNPSTLKLAFLEKPFIDRDLARSGDYDFHAVVGKLTLEGRNAPANWFAEGFFIG